MIEKVNQVRDIEIFTLSEFYLLLFYRWSIVFLLFKNLIAFNWPLSRKWKKTHNFPFHSVFVNYNNSLGCHKKNSFHFHQNQIADQFELAGKMRHFSVMRYKKNRSTRRKSVFYDYCSIRTSKLLSIKIIIMR